ncbi:competence/damage-inducible protein A [Caproiciproducens galactitolivorans]|uniref:Putative competence-damage inducible protein n=1 Tax=Caproiciproducens galactitolivorans TaxID=642589 RepID=A0ABT4BTS3_9FIRM|nr:competence/damage-inducible protein A [Caproiciproducens galactitolivorans]MCY1713321.1 competence/damage-inducible protein A [Caproiciproducens galactitolivorans]
MNAEIISVGTELLLGHTINTDASYVARELSAIGVNLLFASVVGDNVDRLKEALEIAYKRSDVVITTGGLGPTGDDLTKETIARSAGKPLVMHPESMDRIINYFKGRVVGESQKKQAYLPEGCTVFPNDWGTAPGCGFKTDTGKTVVMLPGPPSELIPMLKNYAVPYLTKDDSAVIASRIVRVFGLGEGYVAELIPDLTDGTNPTAATYAKDGEMFVRVTARAENESRAAELCEPVMEELKKRLGDYIYGIDVESLEEAVVQELKKQHRTLATAESCTGGLLSKRITDNPGASEVFHMGVVTYANEIKTLLLDVPEETLKQYGAVSEQTARAMAEGVRKKSGSDLGVGITGIAGPDGGTPEKPVGLVYIALSDREHTWVRKMPGTGTAKGREYFRTLAASNALDMVRRRLNGLGGLEQAAYTLKK